MINVLFMQARRRVGLINAFRAALNSRNVEHKIICTDINDIDPVSYISDESLPLVDGGKSSFIGDLLEVCSEHKITHVIPWQDVDILPLAQNRKVFEERKINLLLSETRTIEVCSDKRLASSLVANGFKNSSNLKVPRIYTADEIQSELSADDVDAHILQYPVIVKPLDGAGSVNVFRCDDKLELRVALRKIKPEKIFVQDFIDGPEFTVDSFANSDGTLHSFSIRERLKLRGGEVLTSKTVEDETIAEIAHSLSKLLKFFGPFNFQLIRDQQGTFWFTEFNPRFSGGATLSMRAGWAAAEWSLDLLAGASLSPAKELKYGLHMMRYHDEIYVEEKDLLREKSSLWEEYFTAKTGGSK